MAALLVFGVAGATGTSRADVIRPFGLAYSGKVYGDFLTIGNAVLGCPSGNTKCVAAMERKGTGNNNDFDMQHVNVDPSVGTFDSSTSRLTIPAGATVAFAHLHWAGNTGIYQLGKARLHRCDASHKQDAIAPPGDPLTAPVELKVGSAATRQIMPAGAVATRASDSGPHYYTAEADIKSELSAAPAGSQVEVTVGNVWAPTGYGCVGGWAMTVVYQYPNGGTPANPHQLRAVYVYEGHVLQRSADPPTTTAISGFQVGAAGSIHAGVTAYEGDYNVPGSRFAVNDTLIDNPDQPSAGTSKFFDSHATGTVDPNYPNNMSVDAKDFVIPAHVVPPGSTSADLTFSTKGDTYLAQVIAFSVPLPEVVISKAANPERVSPGGKVEYTITIKNRGGVTEPAARFTDDLADVIDDARYDHDATASAGTVSYAEPDLTWTGSLAPGASATVTYSVAVGNPPRGNRKINNVIIGDGAEMSCPAGHGTRCETTTEIKLPSPPPHTPPRPHTPPPPPPHTPPRPGELSRPRVVPCRFRAGVSVVQPGC